MKVMHGRQPAWQSASVLFVSKLLCSDRSFLYRSTIFRLFISKVHLKVIHSSPVFEISRRSPFKTTNPVDPAQTCPMHAASPLAHELPPRHVKTSVPALVCAPRVARETNLDLPRITHRGAPQSSVSALGSLGHTASVSSHGRASVSLDPPVRVTRCPPR
jgi:hypothetical protein